MTQPTKTQWCIEVEAMREVTVVEHGEMVCRKCGDYIYCTDCGQRWTANHKCER
jgi:hypothetical protein